MAKRVKELPLNNETLLESLFGPVNEDEDEAGLDDQPKEEPLGLFDANLNDFDQAHAEGRQIRRPIVIDVYAVSRSYGDNQLLRERCEGEERAKQNWSINGILKCLFYWISRGHMTTALITNHFEYKLSIEDRAVIAKLESLRICRRVKTSEKNAYGFELVKMAEKADACVVSLNQFDWVRRTFPQLKDFIESRLLMPMFVSRNRDVTFALDGPQGRYGPSLAETVKYSASNDDRRITVDKQLIAIHLLVSSQQNPPQEWLNLLEILMNRVPNAESLIRESTRTDSVEESTSSHSIYHLSFRNGNDVLEETLPNENTLTAQENGDNHSQSANEKLNQLAEIFGMPNAQFIFSQLPHLSLTDLVDATLDAQLHNNLPAGCH